MRGGYSEQVRQQRGQFLFTVSRTAVSVQKNGHSRRNAVEPHRATFYRGGYNYTPNTFEGRTATLYGRVRRFRMGVDMQIKIDVIIFFKRIIYTRKIVFAVERK